MLGEDLVIKTKSFVKFAALMFTDDLRLKQPLAITGNINAQLFFAD
jgi:hypothetical protein